LVLVVLITFFQRNTQINILAGLDDIQAVLDDHFFKTLSIRGSAFVKPIESEVKEWFDIVNRMIMTLEEWAKVQNQWLYLMPIFSAENIVAQMPNEGVLFDVIQLNYMFSSCRHG
jgi:dynein heavy chain